MPRFPQNNRFMTKVLLMGLGRWGVNHLRNLKALPVELFVAETDTRRLEPAVKAGVPASHQFTNYRDALPAVDAVVIVTPAQTHFPLCQEFMAAGKDVFVEKPITLTTSDARELAAMASRLQRILQVGHIFRFDPAVEWLRTAIQAGKFGQVQMLRSSFSGFKRPRNDSGIMFADAIHFVDLYNYFLGTTPRRVQAVMQDFMGRGLDDATLLSLEYETRLGKTWATIETNYFQPGKQREVSVMGTELSAVCDLNAQQNRIRTFANRHVKEGNEIKAVEAQPENVELRVEEPLKAELQAFVNSVATRTPPSADGQAGVASVYVLEAALESSRTGRIMELPPL